MFSKAPFFQVLVTLRINLTSELGLTDRTLKDSMRFYSKIFPSTEIYNKTLYRVLALYNSGYITPWMKGCDNFTPISQPLQNGPIDHLLNCIALVSYPSFQLLKYSSAIQILNESSKDRNDTAHFVCERCIRSVQKKLVNLQSIAKSNKRQ